MKKRTYIVKQEKGSDVWSVACEVTKAMFKSDRDFDFADHNGWSDSVFDISLTDRYWEVLIRIDEDTIKLEEADYKFAIDDPDRDVWVGLKEVYMIM